MYAYQRNIIFSFFFNHVRRNTEANSPNNMLLHNSKPLNQGGTRIVTYKCTRSVIWAGKYLPLLSIVFLSLRCIDANSYKWNQKMAAIYGSEWYVLFKWHCCLDLCQKYLYVWIAAPVILWSCLSIILQAHCLHIRWNHEIEDVPQNRQCTKPDSPFMDNHFPVESRSTIPHSFNECPH
jgi:hypothetical protein